MKVRNILLLAVTLTAGQAFGLTMQVTDQDGKAIPAAKLMIGSTAVTADANGQFEAPADWKSALPVTVEGDDVVRTTYFELTPSANPIMVNRADGTERIEISGKMTDFGSLKTDGQVDVGVFVPTVPQKQLIYFDIGSMVSPENDKIKIVGQEVAIPSNLVLPKQTESYIVPITLDKQNFRMYVRKPGPYKFLALHAQFPLKRVVDDARAGVPPYDLINHGKLISTGVADLDVKGNVSGLSVPVNKMMFTNDVNVKAPALASDDVVMSVAFSQLDSGELIPSDVKRLRNGQTQILKAPVTKSGAQVMTAWMKEKAGNAFNIAKSFEPLDMENLPVDLIYNLFTDASPQKAKVDYSQVSIAMHDADGVPPQFLDLIAPPSVSGTTIKLSPPGEMKGTASNRTLVIYSAIKVIVNDKIKSEQRTRLWELSVPGWVNEVALPNMTLPTSPVADHYRWEVMYLGGSDDAVTHVTRNATDI